MSTSRIPFLDVGAAYAELREEIDAATRGVMASGQFILGPEVSAFEEEFAAYCETRHAIGVGSGLDALRLILLGYDLGPGDEVVVPSNTFIATWLAVTQAGAIPVPVEPDPVTHNITAEAVEAAITPSTKAIMPVHLYGQPADMDAIVALGRERGIPRDRGRGAGAGRPLPRPARGLAWRRRRILVLSRQEPRRDGRRGRRDHGRRRAGRARAHAAGTTARRSSTTTMSRG